jgi:hypothetical protein
MDPEPGRASESGPAQWARRPEPSEPPPGPGITTRRDSNSDHWQPGMPLALRPPVLLSSSKHRRGRPADSDSEAPSRDVSHDVHPPTRGVPQWRTLV